MEGAAGRRQVANRRGSGSGGLSLRSPPFWVGNGGGFRGLNRPYSLKRTSPAAHQIARLRLSSLNIPVLNAAQKISVSFLLIAAICVGGLSARSYRHADTVGVYHAVSGYALDVYTDRGRLCFQAIQWTDKGDIGGVGWRSEPLEVYPWPYRERPHYDPSFEIGGFYFQIDPKPSYIASTHLVDIRVPLWCFLIGFLLYPTWVIYRKYRRLMVARTGHGTCGKCGYDLHGRVDKSKCPECGAST